MYLRGDRGEQEEVYVSQERMMKKKKMRKIQ